MMDGCVVFSDVVAQVVWARLTIVAKFFLCNAAVETVKFHVHLFESFARDVVGDDSECICVISLYWGGRIFVDHCFQCMACWNFFSAVD